MCELKLDKIQENYDKARAILEALGVEDCPGHKRFKGNRLDISGSTEHHLLVISFDARENTGKEYYSECLNVASNGIVIYLSNPHLSERESKKGRSNTTYLPWTNWLNETYRSLPV